MAGVIVSVSPAISIRTAVRKFDQLAAAALDELKLFHGNEFDPRQVTCERENTNLAEVSLSVSYRGVPVVWQTIDLLSGNWKLQCKQWSLRH